MRKYLSALILLSFSFYSVNGQSDIIPFIDSDSDENRCSLDDKTKELYPTEAEYQAYLEEVRASFKAFQNQKKSKQSSTLVTIPVHVIIIHPPNQAVGTGVNFSMEHIQSQIDVLNEDFRRLNDDAEDTPPEFPAGDSEIEFCLAVVDPDGNDTDGVTRFGTNLNMDSNEFSLKSSTGWPRADYLNIWSAPNLGGILGWAYLPSTSNLPNPTLDGVVTASTTFGGPGYGTNNPYHLGRTTTHEVGHFLGLNHVWGGNGGCNNDDGISDTPNQNTSRFGCPNHPVQSCGSNDMFMNYMDYVNDACMNAFTVEQGEYMQLILSTSRASLAASSSVVCVPAVPLGAETVNVQEVLCNGDSNGSIQIQGIGGTAPYLYSINSGPLQSNPIFENLAAGVYLMTVSDATDNTFSYEVEVTQPDPLLATTVQLQDNLCANDQTGFIYFTIDGGVPPYAVDGGVISGNQVSYSDLAAGVYSYVISDANNCVSFYSVVVDEPTAINFVIEDQIGAACNGAANGSITFDLSGGTPGYTVLFQNEEIEGNTIEDLSAGTYDVVILDDVGCTVSSEFNITEPLELVSSVVVDQDESCLNSADGAVTVIIEGGTAPFTILLNGEEQDGSSLENLPAGSYDVNILDVNSCSTLSTFIIEGGYALDVLVFESIASSCGPEGSGSAVIVQDGGEGVITYLIEQTGESNITGIFENLAAGTYAVQATDENGCVGIVELMIEQTSGSQLNVTESSLVVCNGASDGFITVDLPNPAGVPMFSLDNITFQESGYFGDLAAGNYIAYAIDDNDCLVTTNFTVSQNPAITFEYEATNPLCYGYGDGSIQVSAAGGAVNSSYTYVIDGGDQQNETGEFGFIAPGEHVITITDDIGCERNFIFNIEEPAEMETIVTSNATTCYGVSDGFLTFETINNQGDVTYIVTDMDGAFYDPDAMPAGVYAVEVEDLNGCTISAETTVFDAQPISYEILDQTPANCDGTIRGTISFQATSGEAPYMYAVGQNTNSTGEFDNFNTGLYELTITDNTGCSRVVEFFIEQLPAFNFEITSIVDLTCYNSNDGEVQITAQGDGDFTYDLAGLTNTTGLFSELPAGEYPVEITDETGCTAVDTILITEPTELLVDNVEQTSNAQGLVDIEVEATGGTLPYTYSLDDVNYQNEPSFLNLSNGDYTIYVKDENGCVTAFESTIVDTKLINYPSFTVHPNPFWNRIVIIEESSFSNQAQFKIVSIDGVLIYRFAASDFRAGTIEIDLSSAPAGMYIIEAIDGTNSIFKKLVKQE